MRNQLQLHLVVSLPKSRKARKPIPRKVNSNINNKKKLRFLNKLKLLHRNQNINHLPNNNKNTKLLLQSITTKRK